MHLVYALALGTLLVVHSQRKRSLTPGGGAAAFILALVTFTSPLYFHTLVLLVFYLSGSRLTKYKTQIKEGYEEHGSTARTATQVFCNSFMGALTVALSTQGFASLNKGETCFSWSVSSAVLTWMYIGHYACCAGDTYASELGILSQGQPILITTLRPVPRGTNGGVSLLGLGASLLGGTVVGVVGAVSLWLESGCGYFPVSLVGVGTVCGVFGSLLDSLLGATLQTSLYSKSSGKIRAHSSASTLSKDVVNISKGWDVLDNNGVNLVSATLTSLLAGAAAWYIHV